MSKKRDETRVDLENLDAAVGLRQSEPARDLARQHHGTPGGPTRPRPGGQSTGGAGRQAAEPVLTNAYLREGYFTKAESGQEYLRVELVTDVADRIAQSLMSGGMKTHQIRRFFSYVRALDASLQNGAEFAGIVPRLAQMQPAAENAVKRKLAPSEFTIFINRNAVEARKSQKHFREGFLPHFEAVIAYLPKEGARR